VTRISVRIRTHKGRFCKTIGKSLGRDGTPKKKTFYFPLEDPTATMQRVLELKAEWRRLRASGLTVWEESPAYSKEHDTAAIHSANKPLTVRDAVRLYLERIEMRMTAGQVYLLLWTAIMLSSGAPTIHGEVQWFSPACFDDPDFGVLKRKNGNERERLVIKIDASCGALGNVICGRFSKQSSARSVSRLFSAKRFSN
jgi:hypothetical protein